MPKNHIYKYRISPNIRRGFLPRNIIKKQDSSYNRGLKNNFFSNFFQLKVAQSYNRGLKNFMLN